MSGSVTLELVRAGGRRSEPAGRVCLRESPRKEVPKTTQGHRDRLGGGDEGEVARERKRVREREGV